MAEPVAVIFSDTHLDTNAWSNRPKIWGDSMLAWQYVRKHAQKLGVPIIGAGDLIDVNKPPSAVVNFVRTEMEILEQSNIQFYYTQGQHELATPAWLMSAHSWPTHIHEALIELPKIIEVYGIDWTPADKLQEAIDKIPPDTDVLIMHQVWEEFMGHMISCEGSLTQLPEVDVVITGDFHSTEAIEVTNTDGKTIKVYSPGASNIRSINEPPEKNFLVMYDDLSVEILPIEHTRKVLEFNLADPPDLTRLSKTWEDIKEDHLVTCKDLPEELIKPLIWVKYAEDIPDVVTTIQELMGEFGHIFMKRIPEVDAEELVIKDAERQQILERGLSGGLDLLVEKDSEHYLTLVRLLNSEDPKVDLQQLKQERGL